MTDAAEVRQLKVAVTKKVQIADDIFLFELQALSGSQLPPFTPGAHITVTTPSGQKRRYSLCNDSNERNRYVIAVKQEKEGRGGSLSFTTNVEGGATIDIEPPENEFEMSATEPTRYIFIAGGIGITPIRAMILHCIRHGKTNFKLYYFTRSPNLMAFREEFAAPEFEGKVVMHHDSGDPEQAYDLWPILEEQNGAHMYCCGPRGLMDAVRDMTGHWSDSSVHFEDFVGASARHPDDKPFEVKLAKSGTVYEVAAGVSILDTLRKNGHVLPSSCESGTCGTCRTHFLEGEPDHRDLVLSEKEKKNEIMICVSRAKSSTLTLDI
ncbi:MAG TPA: PDR/VanB family oxidoreductase [Candidatus Acidoferrales bacterium]|nr:PDR/VanB family oxidoreductase [Candidatus Acidoferrales bacterium]